MLNVHSSPFPVGWLIQCHQEPVVMEKPETQGQGQGVTGTERASLVHVLNPAVATQAGNLRIRRIIHISHLKSRSPLRPMHDITDTHLGETILCFH
jgi:hypothetical protein